MRQSFRLALPILLPLLGLHAVGAELRVGRSAGGNEESPVKALVLDDGETRAALVVCDVAVVDDTTVRAARKLIAAQSVIAEANVMIAATGAHAARGAQAASSARIADAVRVALASAQPASAWAGTGREDATGFYNRFLMKDGSVRTNPGKGNSDIVQPAGDADPELTVALFESAAGQPLALFGSFSLPADALDYPAVIARTLGKLHGPDFVTLWSAGAGSNVSPDDCRSQTTPLPAAAEARRVGTVLAGEAIKACARAGRIATPKLGMARESIKLAAAAPSGGPPIEAEVQVITLGGNLAWVGLPGALWTELGIAIRKASPFPQTILVGLANGSAGVLPTRKGYASGALEPGVRAAAGSGETIADTAVRLLSAARRMALRP